MLDLPVKAAGVALAITRGVVRAVLDPWGAKSLPTQLPCYVEGCRLVLYPERPPERTMDFYHDPVAGSDVLIDRAHPEFPLICLEHVSREEASRLLRNGWYRAALREVPFPPTDFGVHPQQPAAVQALARRRG